MTLAAALGGVGVYLAMPRGREHAGRAALIMLIAAAAMVVTLVFRQAASGTEQVWFIVLGLIALIGAVRVITHPRPVYSALYFVMVVLAVAGLLLLLGAEFLAFALVIIYAGAILVTYIFVIMLASQGGETTTDRQSREPLLATFGGFVLMGVIGSLIFTGSQPVAAASDAVPADNTVAVGTTLLTQYAVGVEVAGVLLLAAMIGAIVIARRQVEHVEEEAA
jgi:NADH-quinone oxidoreductase subunit J